jgi:hypothetical protein
MGCYYPYVMATNTNADDGIANNELYHTSGGAHLENIDDIVRDTIGDDVTIEQPRADGIIIRAGDCTITIGQEAGGKITTHLIDAEQVYDDRARFRAMDDVLRNEYTDDADRLRTLVVDYYNAAMALTAAP